MIHLTLYYDKKRVKLQLYDDATQKDIDRIIATNTPVDWFITLDGRFKTKNLSDILELLK